MRKLVMNRFAGEKNISYSLSEREQEYQVEICESVCVEKKQVSFPKREVSAKVLCDFLKKIFQEELEANHLPDVAEDFRENGFTFF